MFMFDDIYAEAGYRRGRLAKEAEQWRLIRWGGVIPPVPEQRRSHLPSSLDAFLTVALSLPLVLGLRGR